MIRGTTPTLKLQLQDIDLSLMHEIHVTIKQGAVKQDIADPEIDGDYINIYFTQEQSLAFTVGTPVEVQVNGLTANNERWASEIATVNIGRQLLDEVIG